MNKRLFFIEPFFEARMWGGNRLKEEFNYKTDVEPVGEVYNVVALEGHADCVIRDEKMTLSKFYRTYPELFDCDTPELPIRVNILDPIADLSVQLHPDEEYAIAHDQSRGKPEAWVILDTPADGYIEFGHQAKDRSEFEQLTRNNDFDKLLKYLPAQKDYFIDIPAGTLHAIGKNVLVYNISRNADCTYRLYDYNRIDPSIGSTRQLSIQKVIDCVNIPDTSDGFVWYDSTQENGCEVTRYWDEPGLYSLTRIKTGGKGSYHFDRFAFCTLVNGSGSINGIPVIKGETVLVPNGYGSCTLEGELDIFIASYKNR